METTFSTVFKMLEIKLSTLESRVFIEIRKATMENGIAFIDHEGIRQTLKISMSSLSHVLKSLERKGAFTRLGRNKVKMNF